MKTFSVAASNLAMENEFRGLNQTDGFLELTQKEWVCKNTITCSKCGLIADPRLVYNKNNNAWRANCSGCGSYIKFLPHEDVICKS